MSRSVESAFHDMFADMLGHGAPEDDLAGPIVLLDAIHDRGMQVVTASDWEDALPGKGRMGI